MFRDGDVRGKGEDGIIRGLLWCRAWDDPILTLLLVFCKGVRIPLIVFLVVVGALDLWRGVVCRWWLTIWMRWCGADVVLETSEEYCTGTFEPFCAGCAGMVSHRGWVWVV